MQRLKDTITGLKTQKVFGGIVTEIDWVLDRLDRESGDDFRSIQTFIAYLVKSRVYAERYLHLY